MWRSRSVFYRPIPRQERSVLFPLNLELSYLHPTPAIPKLPAVAAFPNGLPEALEAIATLPQSSDDSDHSGRPEATYFLAIVFHIDFQ